MGNTAFPTIVSLPLLLSCLALGTASGQNAQEGCYRIDSGIIAGIVIGDLAITIMIAVAIYYFARRGQKKSESGTSVPMPMSRKSKEEPVLTESPYEELHGPERGVYSELKPSYK